MSRLRKQQEDYERQIEEWANRKVDNDVASMLEDETQTSVIIDEPRPAEAKLPQQVPDEPVVVDEPQPEAAAEPQPLPPVANEPQPQVAVLPQVQAVQYEHADKLIRETVLDYLQSLQQQTALRPSREVVTVETITNNNEEDAPHEEPVKEKEHELTVGEMDAEHINDVLSNRSYFYTDRTISNTEQRANEQLVQENLYLKQQYQKLQQQYVQKMNEWEQFKTLASSK